MTESTFEKIQADAQILKIDLTAGEIAAFAEEQKMSPADLAAVEKIFTYARSRKEENIVNTLLKLSRLPLKEPKTFAGFDFSNIHGKNADSMQSLPSLSSLYARRNMAFIGPQGVGKTHLAMAYGRACCERGIKAYFLKATELNQRFSDALKFGHEGSTMNGLVKPSCLIIDEVGRCKFDKECTHMFFDLVDRRYNKEGPNMMIFTSNMTPDKWGEYFSEDSSLLCALDRIFDNATVFMMNGTSYRGRGLETFAVETGNTADIMSKK
jgi:DNA replication protein DnaC